MELRVLVFGAGALGTYIGGSLALAGHRITFLEQHEVVFELRQRGIRLHFPNRLAHIPSPQVVGSIEEALALGPFDVAIFALKSYDTVSALEGIRPYHHSIPAILCLQNGIENEAAIASVLGTDKVIAGTLTSSISRLAAGDIILERLRGVGVAEGHPLSASLVKALDDAGLQARLYPEAAALKWSKLLTNLLANATSAILDMTPAEVFAHPGLTYLEIAQLRETLAVMRAKNIRVVDLPATPVRLLDLGVRYLPARMIRPLLLRAVGGGRGGKMPSFHIDLHSGRAKSEVDYLNGAVVRCGDRMGIPTPANRVLNQTLMWLTSGEIPLEAFTLQPEKLLRGYSKNRT